jgi:hypothetical protein
MLPTAYSFYFKDLSGEFQQEIIYQIDPSKSGKPALLFSTSKKRWTLICTRQVIGHNGDRLEILNLADMRRMLPNGIPALQDQQKIHKSEIRKAEWDELVILDKSNSLHSFHAQAGPDFFALWNVLLMARRLCQD